MSPYFTIRVNTYTCAAGASKATTTSRRRSQTERQASATETASALASVIPHPRERAGESPAPGSYESKTEFRKNNHTRAFSFGISRDSMQKVYLEHKPEVDRCSPGPGFYPLPKPTSS